jgi:hypothetical protein
MRRLAERLVAQETLGGNPSDPKAAVASLIDQRLRLRLAPLMGNVGFSALLSRALVLAHAEAPWLRAVRLNADGTLEGLDGLEAQADPAALLEGRVVVLARLLGLLAAFIGEKLTLGLVHEAWPALPLNGSDPGNRDESETAA